MKTLIVITGPTASGKTALALKAARQLKTAIISADSRQIYRHIAIGTACPSIEEREAVRHYFVEELELDEYYSASRFEAEALSALSEIFSQNDFAVMCGGSMMYVDAVVKGLDELPTVDNEVRHRVYYLYHEKGLDHMLDLLKRLDPICYERVDRKNYKRVLHALEITMQTGRPYSSFLTGASKKRDFCILTFAISHDRQALYQRINNRVDAMMATGFEDEAREVYPLRHLNALNTVGYKELFALFDGKISRDEAIEKIKRNTRVYAKKQLTWLKNKPDVIRLDAGMNLDEMTCEILRAVNAMRR